MYSLTFFNKISDILRQQPKNQTQSPVCTPSPSTWSTDPAPVIPDKFSQNQIYLPGLTPHTGLACEFPKTLITTSIPPLPGQTPDQNSLTDSA